MILRFGECTAEIDADATRRWYAAHPLVNDCGCGGCENFRRWTASPHCDPRIRETLAALGLDSPDLVAELIPWDTTAEQYAAHGGNWYGGFYHVIGAVKDGADLLEAAKNPQFEPERFSLRITDQFALFLYYHTNQAELLPDGFPRPVLQIEIDAYIPWLLESPNEYLIMNGG